jgi:glycosyltransferase involved in cell wall biosynthesis
VDGFLDDLAVPASGWSSLAAGLDRDRLSDGPPPMAPLNVLVFSQYFWPETFRINEVALSLKAAGADVTVLTGKPNYPDGEIYEGWSSHGIQHERWRGIDVLRVPLRPRGRSSALGLALNYLSFIVSSATFGPWLLRGRRIDAILVYGNSPLLKGLSALVIRVFKRAAMVVWVQDLWPESLEATGFVRRSAALKAVEWLVRLLYLGCDRILVQSEAFRAPVARLAAAERIHYHPNPGELAFSLPAIDASASPITLRPDRFNVVFAGNIGTAQAVETIVGAAALLATDPRVAIVLVGSGSRADWVRDEVVRLGLSNLTLAGRFPPEMMPAVFEQASALLVSLTRRDVFAMTVPSKVQAYLAAGRPIVASLDGEGGRVVLESGAGVVTPAEDARTLADAISSLASRPQSELNAMGRAGRTYYETHFEPERLAGRLMTHLREAIAERHPNGGKR